MQLSRERTPTQVGAEDAGRCAGEAAIEVGDGNWRLARGLVIGRVVMV